MLKPILISSLCIFLFGGTYADTATFTVKCPMVNHIRFEKISSLDKYSWQATTVAQSDIPALQVTIHWNYTLNQDKPRDAGVPLNPFDRNPGDFDCVYNNNQDFLAESGGIGPTPGYDNIACQLESNQYVCTAHKV